MQVLREGVDLEGFLHGLAAAPERVLLLDYDGTLAPFREERERALPYPGVREALDGLIADGHTRVVVVSGRWTKDLLPLLGLRHVPEIWGSHGWERRMPDGSYQVGRMDEEALRGLAEADRWARDEPGLEGRAEEKPGCLAIHLRGLEPAEAERVRRDALNAFRPLARRAGLRLHEFDGGVELRVPGRHKGDAVRTVLAESGEGAVVAYLGDDRTDEDAFEALKGRGLSVLVRREPRATAADIRLAPPGELLEFLAAWREHAGGRGATKGSGT